MINTGYEIKMSNFDHGIEQIINDPDQVANLDRNELVELLLRVKQLFTKERVLVNLDGDVVFVGDTHGDFETTKSIVKNFFDADHLVFLGDYVDREPVQWGSIYNLSYLLALKCHFPEKIILLKGNHECDYCIPCGFEFKIDVSEKYGSPTLYPIYEDVFRSMPLMILLKKVFAAHAGILKGTDRTFLQFTEKDNEKAIQSLTWDDPAISGVIHGNTFTESDLVEFLKAINANVFIRGHNYDTLGFSIYGDRCLTIFSSWLYKEKGNRGILIARTDGNVSRVTDIPLWDFYTGNWIRYKAKKR
jgi:protein phosphatase